MDDELRLLHEQAFGRRSDGAARDAAMARLADIDATRRQRVAGPPESSRDDIAAPAPATASAAPAADEPDESGTADAPGGAREAVAPDEPDAAPTTAPGGVERALRRFGMFVASLPRGRAILLWAGSLVATALATLGVAGAVAQIDPWRVAELRIDPDGEVPSEIGVPDDDVVVFEDFAGFAVFSIPGGVWGMDDDGRCVSGFERDPGDDQGSYGFGGCEAGPFPALATLTVDENMPEPLRERFPDGTSLQFELAGDRVIVRAG
ncbi:hypothetical protein [Microbacterium gilvum]|uniref:Uncharacterized protein n=1 Tax=Microbacterium gilvum TaxID=1336204 RepID=A0ABP9AEW4_9MICO